MIRKPDGWIVQFRTPGGKWHTEWDMAAPTEATAKEIASRVPSEMGETRVRPFCFCDGLPDSAGTV